MLKKGFEQITLPLLILHGTADKVTKPSGSKEFYEKAGSTDKTLKLYEGHFHDLLADVGKQQVMADIQAWIDVRLMTDSPGGRRESRKGRERQLRGARRSFANEPVPYGIGSSEVRYAARFRMSSLPKLATTGAIKGVHAPVRLPAFMSASCRAM